MLGRLFCRDTWKFYHYNSYGFSRSRREGVEYLHADYKWGNLKGQISIEHRKRKRNTLCPDFRVKVNVDGVEYITLRKPWYHTYTRLAKSAIRQHRGGDNG